MKWDILEILGKNKFYSLTVKQIDVTLLPEAVKKYNIVVLPTIIFRDFKLCSVYPLSYAMIKNNFGVAYRNLSEVRDKEENLNTAIQAFEEALKIYTVEKYPLDHREVMQNMEKSKQMLKNRKN